MRWMVTAMTTRRTRARMTAAASSQMSRPERRQAREVSVGLQAGGAAWAMAGRRRIAAGSRTRYLAVELYLHVALRVAGIPYTFDLPSGDL
jgi:hypothetical protein